MKEVVAIVLALVLGVSGILLLAYAPAQQDVEKALDKVKIQATKTTVEVIGGVLVALALVLLGLTFLSHKKVNAISKSNTLHLTKL